MDSIANFDSIQDHNGTKPIVTAMAMGAAIKQIAKAMPIARSPLAMFLVAYRSNNRRTN
jgi:hypothetical protein